MVSLVTKSFICKYFFTISFMRQVRVWIKMKLFLKAGFLKEALVIKVGKKEILWCIRTEHSSTFFFLVIILLNPKLKQEISKTQKQGFFRYYEDSQCAVLKGTGSLERVSHVTHEDGEEELETCVFNGLNQKNDRTWHFRFSSPAQQRFWTDAVNVEKIQKKFMNPSSKVP